MVGLAENIEFVKDNVNFIYGSLQRYAAKLTKNDDEALDLIHDLIVKLLDNKFVLPNKNHYQYYYKALNMLFIDKCRKNKSRNNLKRLIISCCDNVYNHDYETCLGKHSFSDEVLEILERLSEKRRDVLLMKSVYEMPYKEISEIFEISARATIHLFHRAKTSFQKVDQFV